MTLCFPFCRVKFSLIAVSLDGPHATPIAGGGIQMFLGSEGVQKVPTATISSIPKISPLKKTSNRFLINSYPLFRLNILAMRNPRSPVFAGCLASSVLMTILSVLVGWAAPSLISRKWAHHTTTLLFFIFGLWSLWEGFTEDGDEDELEEVEEKLNANLRGNGGKAKGSSKADDDSKKQRKPFLTHFFSPIFLKAFSLTFFGEWGDKSQLATISLAADENPTGVVLGGIIGQALCCIVAVIGGKSLASRISEKVVATVTGILFLVFGAQSFISTV
ncbi:GDT1-like protein 5 isoform X2 [Macadamia integrifolia]|uniref:GDT1-like protein 5 isoform X2 n=1 Tax=Macadamia integrifolia TaxID=60698 RepID=UPI001C4FAE3C|nr:GDT1-like protein 5 isoform X2 [Macadamia integrifolia]